MADNMATPIIDGSYISPIRLDVWEDIQSSVQEDADGLFIELRSGTKIRIVSIEEI